MTADGTDCSHQSNFEDEEDEEEDNCAAKHLSKDLPSAKPNRNSVYNSHPLNKHAVFYI